MFTLKIYTPTDEEYFVVHDALGSSGMPVERRGEWSVVSDPNRFALEHVMRWCDRWNIARARTVEDDGVCERCKWDDIPHDNCLYHGNAIGHSKDHCTADACY